MDRTVKIAGVFLMFLPIAACSTNLDRLRETSPTGGAFEQAVAKEYLEFSGSESAQFDWIDSRYFARKGQAAAAGETVLPEDPARWGRIDSGARGQLNQGYGRLNTALNASARQSQPQLAARAQGLFDCWVEQQQEGWQTDHIAACRSQFNNAMDQLEAAMRPQVTQPAPTPPPAVPAQPTPEEYLVFFAWDRADISPVAQQVLERVVEDYRRLGASQLEIAGHADRSGPADYNRLLSERRAEAVSGFLSQRGVPADQISISYYGEEQPLVPTEDGVRNEENRRAVITLGQ